MILADQFHRPFWAPRGEMMFHRERGRPTFNSIGKPPCYFAGKQWLTWEKIKAEVVNLSTEKLLL
jgi:hypothetical protein